MGSPSSRLNVSEQFRPWVDAGLQYIFAPDRGVASAVVDHGVQPQQTSVQPAVQQGAPQQPPVQHTQQAAPQYAQQQPPVQPPSQQPQQPHQPAPVQNPAAHVRFPQPWAGFLAKVRATAPKVICTYMELGLDLGGQPDKKRAAVLRNTLTHHLKWPPGTAAFWPMSALVDGALQPNPSMFWKGWELWQTPYIVCFGDEALRVIHPQSQPGETSSMLNNVSIHTMPPLSQLTTMLPHEQQIAVDQLLRIKI